MDLATSDTLNQVQSDNTTLKLDGKRPREEENGGELTAKKMRRVAEMVLVLSGLGRMRGGAKSPTEAEAELMTEARKKLAQMCDEFGIKPWDLTGGKDAAGAVIEDLGLKNERLKGLGFHHVTQKLKIKDRMAYTKKKMEEDKKLVPPTYAYGSPLERGTSPTVRMLPPERPSHTPTSSGGFPVSTPPAHVPVVTAPSTGHIPSGVSTVSSGLPSTHLGRDSSSMAVPRPQQKPEVASHVAHAPPVQANPSSISHPRVNTPTWPAPPQLASSLRPRLENKVPNHNPVQALGSVNVNTPGLASQASKDQNFTPFTAQTPSGSLPGVNVVQAPLGNNNNNDIAKLVQRLLQPQLPHHPTWTPPSREYMNKALTCQTCHITINDVDSVLVCDGCEKGFHLKCIPNLKAIPKGAEWHCARCLAISNGRPIPPKYGRVMRSTNAPKIPSNTLGLQSPAEKKARNLDPNVNQPKIISNGSSGLRTPGPDSLGRNSVRLASNSNFTNANTVQGNNLSSSGKDNISSSGTHANESTQPSGAASSPVGSSSERCEQLKQVSEPTTGSESHLQSASTQSAADDIEPSQNPQNVQTELPNCSSIPDIAGSVDCSSGPQIWQQEQEVAETNPEPITKAAKPAASDIIEWIGDVSQVVDEKKLYQSCCIDGVTYKIQDHALFRSSHDKLIPSKLQGMWEDCKTGAKWVVVKRCYFPSDLPKSVPHPSYPEKDEVYESIDDSTVEAGSIQGPCVVLHPSKFQEVNESRSQLGTESKKGSQPVFFCKWQYDESKGTFLSISS